MNTSFNIRETWLHRINPSLKLLSITCLFIFAITIHQLNFMLSFTVAVSILFIFFTGHPFKRILLFSLPFLLIFISTAASMILFGKGDTTLYKWAIVHVTEESLLRGIHLGFRALTFSMLGLTFALTTQPVQLFYSLMQQLKLQPKFAYSFMAAVRLIPIMIEEFQTIRDAQKVRGVTYRGLRGFFKMIKSIPIPLLSQSIRRAYRIAVSMEAKRFNSSIKRTFYYQTGFSKYDVFFISYFFIMIGAAFLLAENYPLFPVIDVRHM